MTDSANVKEEQTKLKDFNKIWDGLPMKHFEKRWLFPFILALGAIAMDGFSLRDTYNQVDPGANGGGTGGRELLNQERGPRPYLRMGSASPVPT